MIADIKFFISLFLRRVHYFLLVLVCITAAGSYLAVTLPKVYRAEARLLVESPTIPDDLAASTVRAGSTELLGAVRQRVLTRSNLLETALEYEVYEDTSDMTTDEIVNDMTERVQIGVPLSNDGTGLVLIAFEASSGKISADVTNAILNQILQQNVEIRTEASGQTLEFFEQEVARLNTELAEQGARVLEFQLKNRNALPESVEFQRTRLTALQERVSQINREFSSLSDRRARLTELFEQTGRIDLSEASMSPELRQLRQLQGDLAAALVIYSPESPRVIALRTQVESLQERVNAQTGRNAQGSGLLTAYSLQISDIDGQISFLAEQKSQIEEEMEKLIAAIDATPENAITLGTLQRSYDNISEQFDQATVALAEARTGDRIEALSKGQRIVVIERASIPESPFAPNRKLIVAGSVLAGAAAGAALVFLMVLLNQGIRRPVEVTNAFGTKPFATLPYLTTPRQTLVRYLKIAFSIVAAAIGVPALLYLVHTQVMPLEVVIERLSSMVGA